MERIVYVNGNFVNENEAKVSIFDRALLFSDAVYEVTSVINGKLIDFHHHMKRLDRSMGELEFPKKLDHDTILRFHRELVEKNNITEGVVYMQVSRGVAERDFNFPKDSKYTVTAFTQHKKLIENDAATKGIKILLLEDLRWKRCDIKTTQLLYPSFAKSKAVAKGYDDAWMIRQGYITEGTSNNAWIIRRGTIITRQTDNLILSGITRQVVIETAEELKLRVDFKGFTQQEAQDADEAFITSATTFVTPVVKINERNISGGQPGKITKLLRENYIKKATNTAI